MNFDFDSIIPDTLLARAISLASAGINGLGWTREDALQVLRYTRRAGLIVLGGDLWRHEADRWIPAYENWSCQLTSYESAEAACVRSHELAGSWISTHMRAQETREWVRLVVREPIPYELRSGVCRRRAAPLTRLEFRALEKLIEGPHSSLRILREQFESVFAGERHLTGAGFFRDLQVAAEAPRVAGADQEMAVTGVGAQIPGLEHGAGFILFVREGAMCCLEGYSYGEPWPDPCEEFRLDFEGARASDPSAFRS